MVGSILKAVGEALLIGVVSGLLCVLIVISVDRFWTGP